MTINWNEFTPLTSLTGGLLIGLAAVLLLVFNGKIAGVSGILGGLLHATRRSTKRDIAWRIAFVGGLLCAPLFYHLFIPLPSIKVDTGYTTLIIAGLLVGIGTRYGSGCTSGHGVCGLSRGSLRSLAATLSFMLAGFLTVFVVRHLIA